MRRATLLLIIAVVVYLSVNALVAFGATHPVLQGQILGSGEITRRSPAGFKLDYQTIDYAPGTDAWWIPGGSDRSCVVIVHGYDTFADPKSGDAAPLLDLAARFHGWGYPVLVINLGYATGAHPYSGGGLEADDVLAAARWCRHKSGRRAVLWGFSAGGSAVLLAASESRGDIVAVAADSAFSDAGAVIVAQSSRITRLPSWSFALVPLFMRLLAPPGPADLGVVLREHPINVPVLLVQGAADRSISPDNLWQLRQATGASVLSVPGADHVGSFRKDPDHYLARARAFLDASTPTK